MRGTWRFEPLSHSRRQALWASLACKGPSPYAGTGANSCCCLSAARQVEHRKRRESLALQLFALLSFSLLLVFSSYTFFCTCMLIRRSLQDSCLSSILLLSARDILLLRTSITIYLLGWRRFSRQEEAATPSVPHLPSHSLVSPRSRISRSSYNSPASPPFCSPISIKLAQASRACLVLQRVAPGPESYCQGSLLHRLCTPY